MAAMWKPLVELNLVKRVTHLLKFPHCLCHHQHFSQRCVGVQKLKALHEVKILSVDNKKYSSFRGNFIAKFSEEIDLDALRDQKIKEKRLSGATNFHVHAIVKEILAEKCDEAISKLNAEDEKKLKVIKLEHDFLFSEGYSIPSVEEMTSERWLEALNLSSKNRRLKYYISLQKIRFMKEGKKRRATEKSEVTATSPNENKELKVVDDNKILLRTYPSTIKRWLNHRLSAAMKFGIPLILDMDYGDQMRNRDVHNTADQLIDLISLNRNDEKMPFHLHLTGCPDSNPIYRTMQIFLQDDPHLMATVTPQSYTDLFDKDRLIYLSPDGRKTMREFDPNAVYILGAFNDKAVQKPLSYARAKEQGIRCEKLPLDVYLNWSLGSKALTLNQMMSILTAVKNRKSWPQAFKAVPTRKLVTR